MSVLDLLRSDGSIVVNKFLAKLIGLNEAIILSELVSWHKFYEDRNELDSAGMFFCTSEKMQDNTTLSKHLQSKAITNLVDGGLIETKQKGLPAKRYFKINEQALSELINDKKLKKLTTDNHAEKCTSTADKARGYQKLKKLTTSGQNDELLEVENFNAINTLVINPLIIKEEEEVIYKPAESESLFSELTEKNNITEKVKQDILKALIKSNKRSVESYSVEAIRATFVKAMNKIRTIDSLPAWFATTIVGEQFKVDREKSENEAFEKSKAKYGI
jgi:hypothetical protein